MGKLRKSYIVLLGFLMFCLSGCSITARDTYITCRTGSAQGQDYHLDYKIYTDFGVPSLEETKIHTIFSSKEEAYVFSKKYSNLITNSAGSVTVTESGGMYIVDIKSYEKAKYASKKEYQEMAESLNAKGQVCQIKEN